MPWRLTEPEPATYDWSWWDRALALCERHGLVPIVDLCHFGLPDHYDGFIDTRWVDGFARYVDAFLARYHEPMFFTPVNEPMITAMFSAHLGMWNDRRTSRDDYFRALANVTLANLEAIARVAADRDGWWIGAEGFGCHLAATPGAEPAAGAARALEQLVWDLHFGIEPPPEAADVYAVVDDALLGRIDALAGPSRRVVAGHDFYPVSVTVHGGDARDLSIEERVGAYEREARRWYARYGRPFWVSETSNLGLPVDDGPAWLARVVTAVDRLCADGLPARGVCWYSRGDQYDWQTALTVPVGAVTEVGLFDAARRRRRVGDDVARLAAERAFDPERSG
jgi:beta-glucosidase/6-phospho-beta-glucosidase/beta-galactosidase